MIELLKKYNYIPPQLKDYIGKNIRINSKISYRSFDKIYKYYCLSVNNEEWMTYNEFSHIQAFELFSHYYLAKGHCICTGLGFGIRENWLLQKKEVSKITIIEKNEELIDYHKYINSPLIKECEIIIGDASNLKNKKCDTLLLDHYEKENQTFIFNDVKKISENNEFDSMWFWPLEHIIVNALKNALKNKQVYHHVYDCYSTYNFLKKTWNLNKLPDINEETVELLCFLSGALSGKVRYRSTTSQFSQNAKYNYN